MATYGETCCSRSVMRVVISLLPCLVLLVLLGLSRHSYGVPPEVNFTGPVPYETGAKEPAGLVQGDFNQDGHTDMAITTSDKVYFLLGDGMGGLLKDNFLPVDHAWGLTTADLNGDGVLDLVVTQGIGVLPSPDPYCGDRPGVVVLLGVSGATTPTFTVKTCLIPGRFPTAVVTGDFNEDGTLDLAVADNANYDSYGLTIFFGAGDGTFSAPQYVQQAAYLQATGLATADMNADGHLDFVVSHYTGISVFTGDGTGNFVLTGNTGSANLIEAVAVGDLNGDGVPDIAAVELYNGQLLVCLGRGDGTFAAAQPYWLGDRLTDIALADLNHDGALDIIVVHQNSHAVYVLLGNGDGTFLAPQAVQVGMQPQLVAVGDWNEDGWLDLAVVDRNYGVDSFTWVLEQIPRETPAPTPPTPPTVTITAPANGSTVANTVPLTATAIDDIGVVRVEFYVEGQWLGTSAGPFYTVSWDTLAVLNGTYNLTANAFDAAGNVGVAPVVTVTVDNAAPVITSVPPIDPINAGTGYTYQVTATGNQPLTFSLVGGPEGMAIESTTGLLVWPLAGNQVETHIVTVGVSNALGSTTQSFSVTVVDTLPPTVPTNLVATNVTLTSFTLSWNASIDNVGVADYRVYSSYRCGFRGRNTCYTLRRNGLTTTSVDLSGLAARSTNTYMVRAYDAVGNASAYSARLTVTLAPPLLPPTIRQSPACDNNTFGTPVAIIGERLMEQCPYQTIPGPNVDFSASGNPTPTFSLASGPVGMTIDGVTGEVVWTPVTEPTGTFTATVRATNSQGFEDVTFSYTVYPAGTDLLSPTAVSFQVSDITQTSCLVSWAAATDNYGVEHYTIIAIQNCGHSCDRHIVWVDVPGTETSVTLGDLLPDASYNIWVNTHDAVGNASRPRSSIVIHTLP